MLDGQSLTVDFAKEKEDGYRRIYSRSPLLNNLKAGWKGVYFAYDYLPPGESPEIIAKQHGIGIFVDMPTPAQAERTIDGQFRREQVSRGDIVICPANVSNRTRWNAAGGVVLLGLEPTIFTRVAYEVGASDSIELVPHFATSDPLVYRIGLALKTILESHGPASRLYAETMTNALMVHLLQYYSAQRPTLRDYSGGLPKHKLRQVIDYIHAHLSQDLSLEELAAITQITSHYFCELFKQSMNITPHQYVIQCRTERAKELLHQGVSIAEVAKHVGFVDQSHFHRHFKRLVGMTPKTFQQQFKT